MLACTQLLLAGNTYHSTSIHGKLGSTPYLSAHPSLQPGKNYKTIKYLYRHFGKNIGFFLAAAFSVYKECHFAIPVPHSLCVSMFDYDTYDVNQAVAKTSYTAVSTALGCVARAWSYGTVRTTRRRSAADMRRITAATTLPELVLCLL